MSAQGHPRKTVYTADGRPVQMIPLRATPYFYPEIAFRADDRERAPDDAQERAPDDARERAPNDARKPTPSDQNP